MVSTSARNAGDPWFDSRSRHDRLLYANSVCLYIYIYINNPGHLTKMAATPIYGKNLSKIFSRTG